MRISVAMTTFNGAIWLPRQLHSLECQVRPPDELVVFDDCSSDQTLQILRDFAQKASFPVHIHVQEAHVGTTANFNSAIAAADGQVIAACDQDDVWYPDKLKRMESIFAAGEADLVFSDADVVDAALCPMGYALWESAGFTPRIAALARLRGLVSVLARFNVVTGTAMAFGSKWRRVILPIPEGWVHDGWIALLLAVTGRCAWIDEPLLAYRQHDRQQIGAARRTWRRQMRTASLMDASYFSKVADNFQLVLQRLGSCGIPVSATALHLLQGKIDHCRARSRMRVQRKSKLNLIAREMWSGRYNSAALGWKSVAQDLFQS
jgi:glycosyltransferase involved in cell wall biosynthesis